MTDLDLIDENIRAILIRDLKLYIDVYGEYRCKKQCKGLVMAINYYSTPAQQVKLGDFL